MGNIAHIFNNYKWSITFRSYESLYCTPVTYVNVYNNFTSRFDARYWMLGAGALGRPRGMEWGGREEGSGWGTHVYLWWIHFDIWQN